MQARGADKHISSLQTVKEQDVELIDGRARAAAQRLPMHLQPPPEQLK
jgi:hypothetical protein